MHTMLRRMEVIMYALCYKLKVLEVEDRHRTIYIHENTENRYFI